MVLHWPLVRPRTCSSRDPHTLTPARVSAATMGLKTCCVNQPGCTYRARDPPSVIAPSIVVAVPTSLAHSTDRTRWTLIVALVLDPAGTRSNSISALTVSVSVPWASCPEDVSLPGDAWVG